MTQHGQGKGAGTADLVGFVIENGVNTEGVGFVTVSAQGPGGLTLVGQLSPDELRREALGWLACAEAADQDAAVLRTMRKLELPDDVAALVVRELRATRSADLLGPANTRPRPRR